MKRIYVSTFTSKISYGRTGARQAGSNVVIIDVLRAVPSAIEVLRQSPSKYFMTSDEKNICKVDSDFFRIGKPYMGSNVFYDSPNSPTRIAESNLSGRNIIHRTAGCGGCLDELDEPKCVLLCTFSNLHSTRKMMEEIGGNWDIIASGHQGKNPAQEDSLCAAALSSDNPESQLHKLKDALFGSESLTRFSIDSLEYPKSDIDICLNEEQVPTVIIAFRHGNNWLIESRNQR